MKKFILSLLLTCLLMATKTYAQNVEVIYMRIQEEVGPGTCKNVMTIAYPDNKVEEIPLETIKYNASGAPANTKTIRNKLNQLTDQGYTIISSSIGASPYMTTTIIILTRKKE